MEGREAEDSLAVLGPSGLDARAVETPPPVPAAESAAAVSESLSVLDVEPAAVVEPAAGSWWSWRWSQR